MTTKNTTKLNKEFDEWFERWLKKGLKIDKRKTSKFHKGDVEFYGSTHVGYTLKEVEENVRDENYEFMKQAFVAGLKSVPGYPR